MPRKNKKKNHSKNQEIYNEWPKCSNCGSNLLFIRKYRHKIKKYLMVEFICGEHSCPHINLRIKEESIKFDLDNDQRKNSVIADGFKTKMKKVESQIDKIVSGDITIKICNKCGKNNPVNGSFCVSCGNKLN